MRFSRYKAHFMILSALVLVAFYVITYSVYGGFAHSITFDGGIRFSINMPPGMGNKELKEALTKAGLNDYQTRLANYKTNQYDLEFGPNIQNRFSKMIKDDKMGKKNNDQKSNDQKTTIGEIEKLILKYLVVIDVNNIVSREAISASYGGNLFTVAIKSMLGVIIIIGLYLSLRFDLPFAIGASMALMHDILLTIGFIGVMRIEPSIPVVAAVLTIIGYSINDTIVIFDRIRENMGKRSYAALDLTMDLAITQTLSRTVITSVLTLLAVLALLFGGATSLYDFAKTLLFGVVIGTYSSIFIASHFVQYYEAMQARFRRT